MLGLPVCTDQILRVGLVHATSKHVVLPDNDSELVGYLVELVTLVDSACSSMKGALQST